jgi:hypothetical protein
LFPTVGDFAQFRKLIEDWKSTVKAAQKWTSGVVNYIYCFEVEPVKDYEYLEWGRNREYPNKCNIIEWERAEILVDDSFIHTCVLMSYCI